MPVSWENTQKTDKSLKKKPTKSKVLRKIVLPPAFDALL